MSKPDDLDAVDHAVRELQQFLDKAQHLDTGSVRAIADQFRADAAVARTMRHHRHVYDAISDYFEHAAHVRDKADDHHANPLIDAVRALVENFDDDDDDES